MDPTIAQAEQQRVVQSGELSPAPVTNQLREQLGKAGSMAGNLALGAFVALELNPATNEIPRLAVLTGLQLATHDPALAAGGYAAATFLVEAAGGAATAKLLATERGRQVTRGVEKVLHKMGINNLPNTNVVADSGIAMVAGVPAAIALKQQQTPERTVRENIRYGTLLALGTTAISGVVGYLGVEGIAHPNPFAVGSAALAAGTLMGVRHWVGERLAQRNAFAYGAYEAAVRDDGPQLRGYQPTDYERVVADPATKSIPILDGKKIRQWPALADIRHNTEYMPTYFEQRYGSDTPTYCLSLPSRRLLQSSPKAEKALCNAMVEVLREGSAIVFDQRADEDTLTYIQGLIAARHPKARFDVDPFVDTRNNSQAEVAHYQASISVKTEHPHPMSPGQEAIPELRKEYHRQAAAGEIDLTKTRRTVVIDPADLDKPLKGKGEQTVFGRIAEIYDRRFAELTAEYPVRGEQKSDELENLLRKESTLTLAQMEGDDIAAFIYIADVKDCEWLSPEHFAKTYPGELALYFPGIAADKQYEGRTSFGLMQLLGKLLTPTIDKARLVFQCTNISKEYIPRIAAIGIASTGTVRLDNPVTETCSYKYVGLRASIPERSK